MKKKIIVLALSSILTISGASLAYGLSRNNYSTYNFNRPMMNAQTNAIRWSSSYGRTMMGNQQTINRSNYNFNRMIEIMKENGFVDQARAMENRDYNSMQDFMYNISDEDYDKMIEIMKNNGYESMAYMMESIDKDDMVNIHRSMMGNY